MAITGNRVFISELCDVEEGSNNSGLTMSQVSTFVTAEIAKGTADLIKLMEVGQWQEILTLIIML